MSYSSSRDIPASNRKSPAKKGAMKKSPSQTLDRPSMGDIRTIKGGTKGGTGAKRRKGTGAKALTRMISPTG